MEEEAMSRGMWVADRIREEQQNRVFTRASRRNQPCQHLEFNPVSPTSDFWPPELQYINMQFIYSTVYNSQDMEAT